MKTRSQTKINLNDYVFTFGKHKGKKASDVLEEDAGYLVWCHKNINGFVLSDEDYRRALEKQDDQRDGYWYETWDEHDDWGDRDDYHPGHPSHYGDVRGERD